MLFAVLYAVYHTGAYTTKQTKDKYTGEKYKYYHFIKDMNIIQNPRYLYHILEAVFANLAMKCLLIPTPCEASAAKMWYGTLVFSSCYNGSDEESSAVWRNVPH